MSARKPRGIDYVCIACGGRLVEHFAGNNTAHLVCFKCERVAGIAFEIHETDPPIPGQTTIEEFLDDDA